MLPGPNCPSRDPATTTPPPPQTHINMYLLEAKKRAEKEYKKQQEKDRKDARDRARQDV